MRRFDMHLVFLIKLLILAIPGLALAQETSQSTMKPNPEEDIKHGAVLCIWTIYRAAKEIGDSCFSRIDEKLQAELNDAIPRIDQFIIDNAPMTPDQLEKLKQTRFFLSPLNSLCEGDARPLYEMLQKSGSEKIHQNTTVLLSVPRQPVMNPCL